MAKTVSVGGIWTWWEEVVTSEDQVCEVRVGLGSEEMTRSMSNEYGYGKLDMKVEGYPKPITMFTIANTSQNCLPTSPLSTAISIFNPCPRP